MSSLKRALVLSVVWLGVAATGHGQEKPKAGNDVALPVLLKEKPPEPGKKDDPLTKLLKERYAEALGELRARHDEYQVGRITLGDELVIGTLHRVLESGLELCAGPADKVDLLKKCFAFAEYAEKEVDARFKAGAINRQTYHRARYARKDLEIKLARAELEAKKAEKAKP